MGWCSGTEIYMKAVDLWGGYGDPLDQIDRFAEFADLLRDHDWDCCDEALEQLGKNSSAYKGLAKNLGINLNCKGKCYEIDCAGESACGCMCHHE